MKNCHTRTCLLATLIASIGIWASPLGGYAQEAMETPPAASDATVPTSAAAPSSVAPGPMLEARQKLLARIAAAKAQGIGIAAYQSAFDYNEETIKSGDIEANIAKRIQALNTSLDDQAKRSTMLKTQRPAPPVAASSPPPSAMAGSGSSGGASGGDLIAKLKAKYGGNIPADLKDKLPPGLQEKLGGGGDPTALLSDPKVKELLKGLKN